MLPLKLQSTDPSSRLLIEQGEPYKIEHSTAWRHDLAETRSGNSVIMPSIQTKSMMELVSLWVKYDSPGLKVEL